MTAVEQIPDHETPSREQRREELQTKLDQTMKVTIEMAERLGRDGINQADLGTYVHLLEEAEKLRSQLNDLLLADQTSQEDVVCVGDLVDIVFDDGAHEHFTLVHSLGNDGDGLVPIGSPLGDALLGAKVGQHIYVDTPVGAYSAYVRSRRRVR